MSFGLNKGRAHGRASQIVGARLGTRLVSVTNAQGMDDLEKNVQYVMMSIPCAAVWVCTVG